MPFPVIDVTSWPLAGLEQDGQTRHEWLERPGDDRLWLFKQSVVTADGRLQGEHWAEKLASVMAAALGVPAARVELATMRARAGCISRDVKPHQWELYSGSDLLTGALGPCFDPRARDAAGHNLDNIEQVLRSYGPPPGAAASVRSALDGFASYLLLDALIANQDRHPRNWGVLRAPAEQASDALCPSYDHASGLAFGLTDGERQRRLGQDQVRTWALRGTAQSFEHGDKPWPSLVEHAVGALLRSSGSARQHWRAQLDDLSDDLLSSAVDAVPDMSEPSRRFTSKVLIVNRSRLLEASW